MAVSELSPQLRLLLANSPDAPSLPHLLQSVDHFVSECSRSTESDSGALLHQLEDDLQGIYHEVIDHSLLSHIKAFLSVLFHLRPILPPSSIISTWFDLVLRPALREPKLPAEAVDHAKELIIAALNPGAPKDDAGEGGPDPDREKKQDKIRDFRRRLMDLYLLDAHNESSGDDVLEWAESDDAQKERKACWKANLEDVLVRVGLQRPQDLLTELYHCFASPSSRLQLLILLNAYTSQPDFSLHAAVLASHPLIHSLLNCLIFDNSSTECTVGITVLTKLLPLFAVKACEDLKRLLPSLYVVLARIVCWETRQPYTLPDLASEATRSRDPNILLEPVVDDKRDEFASDNSNRLHVRSELEWARLDKTFTGTASSAPPRQQYFAYLYFLFPCNTIRFLRGPVSYLMERDLESPYTVSWEDALDDDKIRSTSESLLRGHSLHPLLIWRDASEELSQPDFWAKYDVPRIVTECTMLDVRSASLGVREQVLANASTLSSGMVFNRPPDPPVQPASLSSSTQSGSSLAIAHLEPVSSSRLRISLQEMISTSIALKSGLDVEVVDFPASVAWPAILGDHGARPHSPSRSTASASIRSASPEVTRQHESDEGMPSHVALAIAGLQREVLMLRSELNFELWMARENVKHIGRLYQDRVLSRTAEMERQGLHNRLREYKGEVFRLNKDLKEQKEQAQNVRIQYADWNKKLQDKIKEFRHEKNSWQTEAAALRAADKEAKATFAAQSKLLTDANRQVFELQTKIKENAHKVDRLRDYERQIDQLIKLQRLWEIDVQKLNDQTESLQIYASRYKKMEVRLAAYEATQVELENKARSQRQTIQSLEARLSITKKQLNVSRKATPQKDLAAYRDEAKQLSEINSRLREENSEVREEMEEMKAMVELLKGQVSGRQGVVSDPRASPFLGPALGLP